MHPGFFHNPLITTWVSRRWWMVHQHPDAPFYYITSDGLKLMPPDGYLSDGGTIPWWIRWLLSVSGFLPCYIIHDLLCELFDLPRWKKDFYLLEMMYVISWGNATLQRNLVRPALFLFRLWLYFKTFVCFLFLLVSTHRGG